MIHPRTSKKRILKIIAALEALTLNDNAINNRHFTSDIITNPLKNKYKHLSEKLREGLVTKRFNFNKDEARDLVVGLDLFNVIRTNNVTVCWDSEIEKIFLELKKRFFELYNETLYHSEQSH